VTNRLNEPSGQTPIEFVLDLWARRKWVALLVFAAMFSAMASLAAWLPDLYRASATVLVETQQVSEEFVRSPVTAQLETRIETIRQEVMSRTRLIDLVSRLDLEPELRMKGMSLDDMIERLRRDIVLELNSVSATGARGPTIAFEIRYSGRDPATVARVANVLASLYVEENTRIREGQAARTAEFLRAQLTDAKTELDAKDRRVREFNLSHIGELPQQEAANLASLERLNTQLRLNGDSQIRAMDRRERLEEQLADAESAPAPAAAARPALSPRDEQLANLRQQLEELRRKFTDQYPEVIRVRTELAALERQRLERADAAGTATPPAAAVAPPIHPATRLSRAIQDADTEIKALKGEELALRQAIGSYEQRVENVPKRQEEFQALSRDYETTKERYDTLLKRYEEAQLASSLEQGRKVEQFRILDAALPPQDPAAPNRPRLLVVAFMLSIALAAGAVLLAEKLDTAFHSLDDLRGFVNVPTLFSIPLIPSAAATRRRWRRRALIVASIVIGITLIITGSRALATGNERIARLTAGGRL
jgi:polysaccharide chain length determinant protein (PEP-CTERM system associated)